MSDENLYWLLMGIFWTACFLVGWYTGHRTFDWWWRRRGR